MSLFLVRHARPLIDPDRPAAEWGLDPDHVGDLDALRPRLPRRARWATSPEPKAVDTAVLLGVRRPEVVNDLREIGRTPVDAAAFARAVRRTLADPDEPASPGWETGSACRQRITRAVRRLLPEAPREHLVLVGHGTAFTLLVSGLTGTAPDYRRWRALAMPDLIRLDTRAIVPEE